MMPDKLAAGSNHHAKHLTLEDSFETTHSNLSFNILLGLGV